MSWNIKFYMKNLEICHGGCNFAALSNEKVYRTMAKYIKKEMADMRRNGVNRVCYRLKSNGTVELEELARDCARGTTFAEGEIKGVVMTLLDVMLILSRELSRREVIRPRCICWENEKSVSLTRRC